VRGGHRYLHWFYYWPARARSWHRVDLHVFGLGNWQRNKVCTRAEFARFRREARADGFLLRDVRRVPWPEWAEV
jgi:hypothetical protein